MATQRFVLRYGGDGAKPAADVERVRALTGAVVVDSSARMLLVDSHPEQLRDLVESLSDWVMAPERTYEVPTTRKSVERPPE